MAMHKHSHSVASTANHRYSGTSSAFSASANPDEDWTKISDLAERRRIQNRIAQRNYRKKLKKRLEDLERRAASSSASPEQKPLELHSSPSSHDEISPSPERFSEESKLHETQSTPDLIHSHASPPTDDSTNMFSRQYTRQLSTSPPPFSYSTYPSTEDNLLPYGNGNVYDVTPLVSSAESMSFPPYQQVFSSGYPQILPGLSPAAKYDLFSDEEINPFSMNYATLAGIEVPAAPSHTDINVHVLLADSYPRY